MRRSSLLGFTLLVILAVSVITATTASAENPEILPVPTTAAPLNFTFEGGKGKIETTVKFVLECGKVKGSGSFTSQDEGKLGIDVEECIQPKSGAKCTAQGDAAGIVLLAESETSGHFVTLKKGAELLLGLEVVFAEKEKDVIGLMDGVKTLVKTKTAELLFHQTTSGEQEFQECELLKAFCKNKALLLGADFGNGEELLGLEQQLKITFAKETEVHF